MRLYGITKGEIQEAIKLPEEEYRKETQRVVIKRFPNQFSGLPLKVVYVLENNEPLVVTTYLIKRKYRRKY